MNPAAGPPPLRVAALEPLLGRADLWRGDRIAAAPNDGIPTGHAELDAVLPGAGWPLGAVVEILVAAGRGAGPAASRLSSGCGELALLLPALARQTQAGGWGVLVAPPRQPHAPAWAAAGVDLSRLIVVAAENRDRLWAIDRSLRSGAVDLVIAWLPQVDMSLLRRLHLAAEAGRATLFAFRPASVAGQSSPAPLRLLLDAAAEGLRVSVLKRRGPPLALPLTLTVARPASRPQGRPVPPAPVESAGDEARLSA